MKRPHVVILSRGDGEALLKWLEGDALTTDDRRVLGLVLQWYFWLLFALQEAKFSLKRLRTLLFGDKPKKRQGESPGGSSTAGGGDGGTRAEPLEAAGDATKVAADRHQPSAGGHHPGHGRQGAEAYAGAERVVCRHKELAVGERCPVCGQGWLYQLPPGVEIRIDGNALLSAVHEKRSGCPAACGGGA
jgi:hypothetical protein